MSSNDEGESSRATRDYAAAYAVHCTRRDLAAALGLYQTLAVEHPGAREAGYSRTQIANIVSAVVPPADLLQAQVALALAHLEGARPDASRGSPS